MSPAAKSKSKDKKAAKEPPKGSSKPSGHTNTSGGIPASGYNPLLGTFHTFDTSPVPSPSPLQVNGRFRNIDDTDDHNGNSVGTGTDYDSVSNNGSWSGESEDHKEKISQSVSRQESVPGADNDKREKIRQKNEKKHQRQKERRAQELHERCSGYLMSRKLEALAQKLVSMGFSQERATMALILNEGRVEESVSWLFEGGEEDKRLEHNLDIGCNLKIDISEEMARITDMEIMYKYSKQEVERAVVACEGDLDKAEEALKSQKQVPPAVPPKLEETDYPPIVANSKLPVTTSESATRVQAKPTSAVVIQQKRDEKDFNYAKPPPTIGPSLYTGTKDVQPLKKILPRLERTQPQQIIGPAEKKWPSTGSNPAPLQASPPQTKMEAHFLSFGNELKNLQLGSVREPVIVMQQPQSVNAKQTPSFSVSYPNNVDKVKRNGLAPPVAVSRSLSPNDVSTNPLYNQLHYQSQQQQQQFVPSSSSVDPTTRVNNGSWGRVGASPTLSVASSLGLFSGLGGNGSSGSSSPVDWTTGGSMLQVDYSNIDWSLDLGSLASKPSEMWAGGNYSLQSNGPSGYGSFGYGMRPPEGVGSNEGSGGGSREWASPFEEKDIFSLPRQFVSSPSL